MTHWHQGQNNGTAVLLAAGFEEETVVALLCQMRDAGLPVSLVSLSSQPLSGTHGVTFYPDKVLSNLPKESCFRLVIIPGNGRCVHALLTSPRFHHLLKNTLAENGYAAVLDTAVSALDAAGIPSYAANPDHYIRQNNTPLPDFIARLIHLAKTSSPADSTTIPPPPHDPPLPLSLL